ncbi:14184_t:CDS:2, partial [Dentiscutata erythropus]
MHVSQLMEDYGDNSDPEPDYWTPEKNDFPNNALSRSQSMLSENHNIPSNSMTELTTTTSLNVHLSPSPDTLSLNDFDLKRIIFLFMSRSRSNTINEDSHIISSLVPFRRGNNDNSCCQRADEIRSHFARDKSLSRRHSITNNRAARMSKNGLLRQITPNNVPMEMSCSIRSRPSSPFIMRHSRTTSMQTKTVIG